MNEGNRAQGDSIYFLVIRRPIRVTRKIQLGATDEGHIIRTIEYWDMEKNRYPQYEHVAVLVAEDITGRFLNVISLFNRSIPLIAIQMSALQVGDAITLNATTVLDVVQFGTDDEDEPGQATDRSYWESKGSKESLEIADRFLRTIREVRPELELKYNKHYIGLARNGIADNFVSLRLRKEYLIAEFRIPRSDLVSEFVASHDLDALPYDKRWGRYRIRVTSSDLETHIQAITELIALASNGVVAKVEE